MFRMIKRFFKKEIALNEPNEPTVHKLACSNHQCKDRDSCARPNYKAIPVHFEGSNAYRCSDYVKKQH